MFIKRRKGKGLFEFCPFRWVLSTLQHVNLLKKGHKGFCPFRMTTPTYEQKREEQKGGGGEGGLTPTIGSGSIPQPSSEEYKHRSRSFTLIFLHYSPNLSFPFFFLFKHMHISLYLSIFLKEGFGVGAFSVSPNRILKFCTVSLAYLAVSRTHIRIIPYRYGYHRPNAVSWYHCSLSLPSTSHCSHT